MKTDNNIDNLFRDKLYNRDFEFDQSHWEKAEKLIDADKKHIGGGITGKKIIILLSVLVLFLTLIIAVFYNKNQSAQNSDNPKQISEKINPDTNTPERVKSNNSPENNSAPSINIETVSAPNTKKQIAGKTTLAEVPANTVKTKTVNPVSKQSTVKIENSPEMGREFPVKENIISENPIPNSINKFAGDVIPAKKETDQPQNSLANPPEVSNVEKTELQNGKPLLTTEHNLTADKQNTEVKTPATEPETQSQQTSNATDIPKAIPSTGSEKQSEVTEKTKAEKPLKDRINWLRHVSIGVSVGANISQGLRNTGTSRAAISTRPVGGVRVAYQLNEQVDIETGLLYDYRAGVNSKTETLISRDISKNVNHYSTNSTLSLHYLDIPLQLTYKHRKHSIVVGIQYCPLVNIHSEIKNTKDENGSVVVEQTTKQFSKNDGRFASYDLMGTFGYEYEITDRLKICGRYNLGLFDVTDDSSFGNSVRDKNNQVRIMIDYRFVKY